MRLFRIKKIDKFSCRKADTQAEKELNKKLKERLHKTLDDIIAEVKTRTEP